MELNQAKISNYTGQSRQAKLGTAIDDHFVAVDRDLQHLWNLVNDMITYVPGSNVEDVNFGAGTLGKGAAEPDNVTISSTSIVLKGFDGNVTTEQLYGAVELPHSFKSNTNLAPHVHWMPVDTNVGNVKWQMEYFIATDGGNAISTSNIVTVSTSTTGIAWQPFRSDFTSISGTSLIYGQQVAFRFFRNPTDSADTYPSDAVVETVGFHYTQDSLGSYSVTKKRAND